MKHLINTILKTGTLFLFIAAIFAIGCQQPKPDPFVELKPILDKGKAIWNTGNFEEADKVWDPSVVRSANGLPDVNGINEIKKVITAFRAAYPDLKLTSDEEIYADNKITLRWTLKGTNTGPGEMPPTGKQIKIWGISILHFANGKLTSEFVSFDNQALMEQLGYTMMPMAAEKK